MRPVAARRCATIAARNASPAIISGRWPQCGREVPCRLRAPSSTSRSCARLSPTCQARRPANLGRDDAASVINPGSTSSWPSNTVIIGGAVRVDHPHTKGLCPCAPNNTPRRRPVFDRAEGCAADLDAVVGRGGMLRPIPQRHVPRECAHASSCAPGRARKHISNPARHRPRRRAFGIGETSLPSLNLKAAARHAARELGAREDVNLVVAHLGAAFGER